MSTPDDAPGRIEVEVTDGIVKMDGSVPRLDHKRLAGALAWWVPGSRDVVDGIAVHLRRGRGATPDSPVRSHAPRFDRKDATPFEATRRRNAAMYPFRHFVRQ